MYVLKGILFCLVPSIYCDFVSADQITIYPVQSGLVSDGSCCSPYTYSDSAASEFNVSGCFNSTYGCGFRKEYVAWRWDLVDVLPEDAFIGNVNLRWSHPQVCQSSWTDIWIDSTASILSSAYLSVMNADQFYNDVDYWNSTGGVSVDSTIISNAMIDGYVAVKIGNGVGGDGCNFINHGKSKPRLVITYSVPEPPCLADLDGNDSVDAADLGIFLALWNSTNADADFNGDDYVDANDLGLLLVAWGDCP